MNRPKNKPLNPDKRSAKEVNARFWDMQERLKRVRKVEEKEVFHLTQAEAKKCMFTKPDKNTRMCECTVHNEGFTHGVRLFPPHLWDWKDGKIFQKVGDKWVRWFANIGENKTRFDK